MVSQRGGRGDGEEQGGVEAGEDQGECGAHEAQRTRLLRLHRLPPRRPPRVPRQTHLLPTRQLHPPRSVIYFFFLILKLYVICFVYFNL